LPDDRIGSRIAGEALNAFDEANCETRHPTAQKVTGGGHWDRGDRQIRAGRKLAYS
jgi:hypothetical protein